MSRILFVPLNTNHVSIFESIVRALGTDYMIVCHDRISDATQYHTEAALRSRGLVYTHFSNGIHRSSRDSLFQKAAAYLEIRRQVSALLDHEHPAGIVFAIDNDPIARAFIGQARRRGIKTVLVQEALIRPGDYRERRRHLSDYGYELLQTVGLHLTYSAYGMSGCDAILVAGPLAFRILRAAGIPEDRLHIVGQPKYDGFVSRVADAVGQPETDGLKTFLYAASTTVAGDDRNVRFLKTLASSARDLGFHLIIKLHPRSLAEPSEVKKLLGSDDSLSVEVLKGGDDTLEILKRSCALITVSSTVVIEALMMDKECIVADYLAGDSRLGYDDYDALHRIRNESGIGDTLLRSIVSPKRRQNKLRLLDDELYRLDGKAGVRAAQYIEGMIR